MALTERLDARQQTIDELEPHASSSAKQRPWKHRRAEANSKDPARAGRHHAPAGAQADRREAGRARRRPAKALRRLQGPGRRRPEEQQPVVPGAGQGHAGASSRKRPRAISKSGSRPSTSSSSRSRRSLEKVDTKIQDLEKARAGAYEGLKEQVKSLLGNAEGASRPRPRTWSRRCAARRSAAAGARSNCGAWSRWPACSTTATSSSSRARDTDDGRLRPDLLVRLPGGKTIVVDSKAPLAAYLDAIEAPDDETRGEKLQDHARQVRTHITALGRKSYFEQFDHAAGVRRAVPAGRGLLQRRAGARPGADRDGRRPERDHRHADHADRAVAGGGLRLAAGGAGRERQGDQRPGPRALRPPGHHEPALRQARQEPGARPPRPTTRPSRSLESRVLVSARKFKDLQSTGAADEIEQLSPVETTPRLLQAPELLSLEEEGGKTPP